MKISCYTDYGPLNSKPVFAALLKSMQDAGDTVLLNKDDGQCDVAVIWSVLWQGRMASNGISLTMSSWDKGAKENSFIRAAD